MPSAWAGKGSARSERADPERVHCSDECERRAQRAELSPDRGGAQVAKSREGAAAPASVGNHLGEACLLQGGSVMHGCASSSVIDPFAPPDVLPPGGATPLWRWVVDWNRTTSWAPHRAVERLRNPPVNSGRTWSILYQRLRRDPSPVIGEQLRFEFPVRARTTAGSGPPHRWPPTCHGAHCSPAGATPNAARNEKRGVPKGLKYPCRGHGPPTEVGRRRRHGASDPGTCQPAAHRAAGAGDRSQDAVGARAAVLKAPASHGA